MKKHLLLAVASLLMAFSFMSCKKMGPLATEYFKVEPHILVAKAGVVDAKITGTFPEKYFKKNSTVVITPVLKYNGTEERLATATFQGEKVKGNNQKIQFKAGGQYTHRISFDFKPGMEKSELYLQFEVKEGSKSIALPEVKIADGIICTYMLAKAQKLEPAFASDFFQRSIATQQEADINFLVNQTNIRSTELNAEDIAALTQKFKEVSANDGSIVTGVEVSAFASPEGGVDVNTKLAEGREKVAVAYVNKQMENLQSQVQVDSRYTAEDWEGFQQLVQSSSMQDKELILSVLSQFTDPDQREVEIRKISAAYKVLADEILPQLRRSKMRVSFEISGKTDEELIVQAQSNPDLMTVEELLFTATLVSDLDSKAAIYKKASELYPSDWRTFNNLGAVKLLQDDIDEAERLFSQAIDLNSTRKETNYNWGIIKMMRNEIQIAESFLGKAPGIGDKLDAALGVIYLWKGDYGAANKALTKDKSNNAVVAKLVVNDLVAAEKAVNDVKSPNETTKYLKAIIAARGGDKEGVLSNLALAVRDPELKKRAAVDIEFGKYSSDPAFIAIVN